PRRRRRRCETANDMLSRVRGELKIGEWVGEVWVDAVLRYEHVGTEPLEEGRDDLVEGAHVREVVGVRRERDVDAVPGSFACAALVRGARAGEERPAEPRDHAELVQRD